MPNVRGMEFPYTPEGMEQAASVQRGSDISAVQEFDAMGRPSPPMGPPMAGPGGQGERLSQLLEARQMIDQEIAAIVGAPPGAENLDILPPPPVNPMAQMPPEAMGAPNGMGGPPMAPPMPPMGPQGLLGV
jgi:hypothetical protein